MIVLDGTIVGVALPTIIADLGISVSEAQWVNGIYSVVFAALLLTAGRVGDRIGRRRMLLMGIAAFVIGSLLAAISSTAALLIASRVVQGVGGAMILPTTLSSVNATFRGRDRAIAFGVWGAVISGMAALGPLLGGWITSMFSWQWIFLVNLPLGAALVVAVLLTVDESREPSGERGFDLLGLLLSVVGLGLVVFGLIEGAELGWWAQTGSISIFGVTWGPDAAVSIVPAALITGAVALVAFTLWQRHRARVGRSRILDLSLFTVPTFRWGNVAAMCVAMGEFGLLFVLPLLIIEALGASPMLAGLTLAAMGLGAFLAGASARHIAARFSPPTVVIIGLVLETAAVLGLAAVVSVDLSLWVLTGILLVYGVGLGLASAQLTGTVLADIPVAQSGQGSATQSTVRQIGSALGTAVIGTVFVAGFGALPQAVTVDHETAVLMADAARWALLVAGGFLAVGAVSALRLRQRART